jgi:dolichol-phosphate mannosyltransferase
VAVPKDAVAAVADQRTESICVIPALNESGKIGRMIDRFQDGAVNRVIVVDDGSTDATASEARDAGAEVISHRRRNGVGAALRTGYLRALDEGVDLIVTIGGDDQDDPAEVERLLAPLRADDADFVQGSRRVPGAAVRMPLFRRVTTKLYSWIFRLATGAQITDATNGYRAFRADLLRDPRIELLQEWLDTYELEPYLVYKAVRLGYRVVEVPVSKRYDTELGYTKMTPGRDWWRILRPIVLLRLGLRR